MNKLRVLGLLLLLLTLPLSVQAQRDSGPDEATDQAE